MRNFACCGGNTILRACFGDERADYAEALERYYRDGPRAAWTRPILIPSS